MRSLIDEVVHKWLKIATVIYAPGLGPGLGSGG